MIDDNVRKNIKALMERTGDDMATVSRNAGMNSTYIQQFLKRGSPKELPDKAVRNLAEYYGVPEDTFRANKDIIYTQKKKRYGLSDSPMRETAGKSISQEIAAFTATVLGACESLSMEARDVLDLSILNTMTRILKTRSPRIEIGEVADSGYAHQGKPAPERAAASKKSKP